jgi:hypothetical protein
MINKNGSEPRLSQEELRILCREMTSLLIDTINNHIKKLSKLQVKKDGMPLDDGNVMILIITTLGVVTGHIVANFENLFDNLNTKKLLKEHESMIYQALNYNRKNYKEH